MWMASRQQSGAPTYVFQALEAPAEHHQIQLVYEDKKLLAGAVLSCLGLLACAGLWVLAHFRMRLRSVSSDRQAAF
jgi:hypothetical protein